MTQGAGAGYQGIDAPGYWIKTGKGRGCRRDLKALADKQAAGAFHVPGMSHQQDMFLLLQ